MSSNEYEKSIKNLIRLTEKELKDLRIQDILADPELNEAFKRAKPKHWSELTEEEKEAHAEEQAKAEQEYIREQKILKIKKFFQLIMKAKRDEPNSKLFTTAEELLEFVVKYESDPSSVNHYEWNKFETILLTKLELLLQADGKEKEPTKAEQETRKSGDTYIAKHISFGNKAKHAGRDIHTTTPEPKKKWPLRVMVIGVITTILIFLFGDDVCTRFKVKSKSTKPPIEQTMNDSPGGVQITGDVTFYNLREETQEIIAPQTIATDHLEFRVYNPESNEIEVVHPVEGKIYTTHGRTGCRLDYMTKDGKIYNEYTSPDGKRKIYSVVDSNGNVIESRLPYPLDQYTVVIPPELELRREEQDIYNGWKLIKVEMKWDGSVEMILDPYSKLQWVSIKGGVKTNHKNKTLVVGHTSKTTKWMVPSNPVRGDAH